MCQYGEVGDKFFIIIKGLVSIKIRNPTMKDWNVQWKRYNNLIDWKNEFFEPQVDLAIKKKYLSLLKVRQKTFSNKSSGQGGARISKNLKKLKFGIKRVKETRFFEF